MKDLLHLGVLSDKPHFDFISQSSTNAIMNLSINSKNQLEMEFNMFEHKQAIARKKKGAEAVNAVISIYHKNENFFSPKRIILEL